MRIGLNLLPVRPGIGGSWNYIQALINALAEHDRENEYVLFVTQASARLVPSQPNFRAIVLRVPTAWRSLRVLIENSLLRFAVSRARLDCIHHVFGTLPFVGKTPTVVTMFDLMEFDRPQDISLVKRAYLHRMRWRAAKHATMLAPMSKTTANDVHRRLNVSWSRMAVVSASMGPQFTPRRGDDVEAFRLRHGLPREFWLVVANHQSHKNYDRLIAAFAQLRRSNRGGWALAIRGAPSRDLVELIEKHGISKSVTFVPRLAAEEMPLLYSAASALVFPSLFEGGGLPVMEAMACGCPVVASNIPTTSEFAASAAITFAPTDIGAIVDAMRSCEESPELRSQQVDRGLAAAAKLRPKSVALACMSVYRRAAAAAAAAAASR